MLKLHRGILFSSNMLKVYKSEIIQLIEAGANGHSDKMRDPARNLL